MTLSHPLKSFTTLTLRGFAASREDRLLVSRDGAKARRGVSTHVIASVAKQSSVRASVAGLLRYARNDGVCVSRNDEFGLPA